MIRVSAFKCDFKSLRELMQLGADISSEDEFGNTAIHLGLLSPDPFETLKVIGEYKKETWEVEKLNKLINFIESLQMENK